MSAFIAQLSADSRPVVLLGGGFNTNTPRWWRLIGETWSTLTACAKVQIVSVPPYRSALAQVILTTILPRRRIIIDQRDVALNSAHWLERWIERAFIRRADALIVTTHAQRREMAKRYGQLPHTMIIRNGASNDITTLPPALRSRKLGNGPLRVLYQGLVGGKMLKNITMRLAMLGCDVDLAVFFDSWSHQEIKSIEHAWNGAGKLSIHANCDAPKLIQLMSDADVALNPIPENMTYAFTVKTSDYAVRGIPQLVIGPRSSVSRRVVELCRLGHAIDGVEMLDEASLKRAIERFRPRTPEALRVFQRDKHAPRLLRLLKEIIS